MCLAKSQSAPSFVIFFAFLATLRNVFFHFTFTLHLFTTYALVFRVNS